MDLVDFIPTSHVLLLPVSTAQSGIPSPQNLSDNAS